MRWALKRDAFPGGAPYELGSIGFAVAQLGTARRGSTFPVEEILACRQGYLDALRAVAEASFVI